MRRSWIHLSTEASNITFAKIKVCACVLGKGRWELADLEKWGLQSPYNYTEGECTMCQNPDSCFGMAHYFNYYADCLLIINK